MAKSLFSDLATIDENKSKHTEGSIIDLVGSMRDQRAKMDKAIHETFEKDNEGKGRPLLNLMAAFMKNDVSAEALAKQQEEGGSSLMRLAEATFVNGERIAKPTVPFKPQGNNIMPPGNFKGTERSNKGSAFMQMLGENKSLLGMMLGLGGK